MTRKVTMLGTGHAMVTKCYNTCFILSNENEHLLVDAGGGNGILVQMEKADVSFKDIHKMFITHGHTDHLLGAIWVIRMITTLIDGKKYEGKLDIYCHDEVAKTLEAFCEMTLLPKQLKHLGTHIHIHTVEDGAKEKLCGMEVTFFDIHSNKTKQFGFEAKFSDGKRLVCLGDEPYNEKCVQYAGKSDWLLSEAFCLYEEKDIFKPYEKHHSTALDAGKLADTLEVKNLILYHTEDKNIVQRKQLYTQEAAEAFKGNIVVPEDLETIILE